MSNLVNWKYFNENYIKVRTGNFFWYILYSEESEKNGLSSLLFSFD